MFLGRVVLPAVGLAVAVSLTLELHEKDRGSSGINRDALNPQEPGVSHRAGSPPRGAWLRIPAPR